MKNPGKDGIKELVDNPKESSPHLKAFLKELAGNTEPDDVGELVEKICNLAIVTANVDEMKDKLRTLLRNRMATEEELRWLDKIIAYYRTFKEGLDYSESREISKFRESIRKKLSGEQGGK